MRTLLLGIGATAIACSLGCSKNTGSWSGGLALTLKGNVPASTVSLDNARVVAVGSNGHVYWSYVNAARTFSIALPAGASYRILVTNSLATGQQRIVGHLVNQTPAGPTEWIGTGTIGTFDLGSLRRAPSTSSQLAAQDHGVDLGATGDGGNETEAEDGGDDSKGDGGLDCDTHEDSSGGASLCGAPSSATGDAGEPDDDVELDPDHDPGNVLGSSEGDKDKDKDKDKDTEGTTPCPGGDAGGTGSSSGGATGSASGSSSGSSSSSSSGGSGSTTTCTVNADCAAPLVCVAGTCTSQAI
jgi:hypothetical protein